VRFQKKTNYPKRISWGWGLYEPKILAKYMKLNWNFQRGRVLGKIPSVGEVWIFVEQYNVCTNN